MSKGIEETGKSFIFRREIGKNPVKISLQTGWIWVEEVEQNSGASWIFKPTKLTRMTFTTEDARNLIAAIQELIPEQESNGADRGGV